MITPTELVNPRPLREWDTPIRDALYGWIRANTDVSNAYTRQEYAIGGGGIGYADLCLCQPDALHGFEIKSERDSLTRLENQVRQYDYIFETSTLVCAPKHWAHAEEMLPPHWGLLIARTAGLDGKSIAFEEVRIPKRNPSKTIGWVEGLLWRIEGVAILDKVTPGHKMKWQSRGVIKVALIQALPPSVLERLVVREIRKREKYWWTFDEPSKRVQ